MTFQIPSSEREHMAALVSASPALLDAIVQTLEGCPLFLSQRRFNTEIAMRISNVEGANPSNITSIMRTLFAVHSVLIADSGTPAMEAAEETVETLLEDGSYGVPPDGWESFRNRLAQLLSSKTLAIAAKVGHVAFQTPRHTTALRILSDVRPIFGHSAREGPAAFAILHALQIEYIEEGENREWFVSLDSSDIESLRAAVDRVVEKEAALRKSLHPIGVPILSWGTTDDDI